jgi:hypothetical protein
VAQDERVQSSVMNNVPDFEIARDCHWYRDPVRRALKRWQYAEMASYKPWASGEEE